MLGLCKTLTLHISIPPPDNCKQLTMVRSLRLYCSTSMQQVCSSVLGEVARTVVALLLVSAFTAGRPVEVVITEETALVITEARPPPCVLCRGRVALVSVKLGGRKFFLTKFF